MNEKAALAKGLSRLLSVTGFLYGLVAGPIGVMLLEDYINGRNRFGNKRSALVALTVVACAWFIGCMLALAWWVLHG